jgi:hypothetical protein
MTQTYFPPPRPFRASAAAVTLRDPSLQKQSKENTRVELQNKQMSNMSTLGR